jgi:hypothetical protein
MKLFRVLGLAMLFFLAGSLQAATLAGSVTNAEDGLAVPNAVITCIHNEHGVFMAESDAQGAYFIEALEHGSYFVTAEAEGFNPWDDREFHLENGENFLDIALTPSGGGGELAAQLEGLVLLEDHQPAAGALVSLVQEGQEGQVFECDATGSFSALALFEGFVYVYIEYDPNTLGNFEIFLHEGSNAHTFTLQGNHQDDPFSLSGQVLDAITREPLVGAALELRSQWNPELFWSAVSAEEGFYSFDEILTEERFLVLETTFEGYEDNLVEVHVNHQHAEIDVLMMLEGTSEDLAQITGSVYFDDGGALVPFVWIEAIENHGHFSYFGWVTETGDYTIDLPAGEYKVACYMPEGNDPGHEDHWGYVEYFDDVQDCDDAELIVLSADQIFTGVDFGLPNPQSLETMTIEMSGFARDTDGAPLADAHIRFWSEEGMISDGVYCDESGAWFASLTMDRLPIIPFSISAELNDYEMTFFASAGSYADATRFTFTSDASVSNVNFDLAYAAAEGMGFIGGSIENADGASLSDAIVVVLDPDLGIVTSSSVNASGAFSIEGLPEQDLTLMYLAPGYSPRFAGDALDMDSALIIDAQNAGTQLQTMTALPEVDGQFFVTGQIVNELGQPLSGALLLAHNAEMTEFRYAFSDASGHYTLSGLQDESTYTVLASLPAYNSEGLSILTNSSEQLTYRLDFELVERTTSVREPAPVLKSFNLEGNYPNPFNPTTLISFSLDVAGLTSLTVFNVLGEEVAQLLQTEMTAGQHQVSFNAQALPSGLYIACLQSAGQVDVQQMLLIK